MPRIKRTDFSSFWPAPSEPAPAPSTDDSFDVVIQVGSSSMVGRTVTGRMSSAQSIPHRMPLQFIATSPVRAAEIQRLFDVSYADLEVWMTNEMQTRAIHDMEQQRPARGVHRTLARAILDESAVPGFVPGLVRARRIRDSIEYEFRPDRGPITADELNEALRVPPAPRPDPRQKNYNYYEERQRNGKAAAPPSDLLTRLTRRL